MKLDHTKSTATADEVYARIQRKQEVLERLKSIGLELTVLSQRKAPLEYDLQQTRNALRGYHDERLERFPEERKIKNELELKAQQMKEELDKIIRKMDSLEAERQRLKEIELPACIQETEMAEVLAHQDAVKALRADAQRLDDAIAAQRQIISQAKTGITPVQDQSARRAEILADMAIGEASQKDLDKLDAVVAADRQAHEDSRAKAEPIISQATQTIAGLESKLTELNRKIAWKERDNALILEQYLMTQIKAVGALYTSHALALKESFCKLVALDTLLKDAAGVTLNVIPYKLTIPLPKLDECKEHALSNGHPDLIFTTQFAGPGNDIYKAMVNAERERLVGEGCELL